MEKIFVTLRYGRSQSIDLALPSNIPSQFLAEAVARSVGIELPPGQVCFLEVTSAVETRRISAARSLEEGRVLNGSFIQVGMETSGAGQKGYLAASNGIKFPLLQQTMLIGRPAGKGSVPDIDLSPLDHEHIVSRKHALVRVEGGQVLLLDVESRHGTWLNGQRLGYGEARALKSGDKLTFGPLDRGVVLTFSDH